MKRARCKTTGFPTPIWHLLCSLQVAVICYLCWSHLPTANRVKLSGRGRIVSQLSRRPRFAVACAICNATDYRGGGGAQQIFRAGALLQTVSRYSTYETPFETVALVSNFHTVQDFARQGWDRIHRIDYNELAFKSKFVDDGKTFWPTSGRVQRREDGRCTTLKFNAWALKYDAVLVLDTDVCLEENPYPFLAAAYKSGHYFLAFKGVSARRAVEGFNTHMIFLQPNTMFESLLRDKARNGEFMPFTNTEQDVLDTVFSAATSGVPRQVFPKHQHGRSNMSCWATDTSV